jgi:hypothetical protein
MPDPAAGALVVQVLRGQHRKALWNRSNFDGFAGIADPEGVSVIDHDHVEGAIGPRLQSAERLGRFQRVGMVESLEHQLAPAALAGGGPQASRAIHDSGDEAVIVEAEPASAGLPIEAGYDPRPVGPVAAWREPRAIVHLVAIGSEKDRPAMTGPAEDDDAAHGSPGVP